MKMKLKIFFALLLAACSLSVSAEAYLGLSVGAADYNDSLWSVEDGANDVGWKLFGGVLAIGELPGGTVTINRVIITRVGPTQKPSM